MTSENFALPRIAGTACGVPDPEALLSLSAAAGLLPARRSGRRAAPSTLFRWAREGVRAADGSRIRLRTTQLGGTTVTCRAWIAELSAALADIREAVERERRAGPPDARPERDATERTLRSAGLIRKEVSDA